jgi:hypothetical protein
VLNLCHDQLPHAQKLIVTVRCDTRPRWQEPINTATAWGAVDATSFYRLPTEPVTEIDPQTTIRS